MTDPAEFVLSYDTTQVRAEAPAPVEARPRCLVCPVAEGAVCLGATADPRFGGFCGVAASGPSGRAHVVGRSALGADPPAANPPSMVNRAVSLVGAVVEHVASGWHPAPEAIRAARLAACAANVCGQYREDGGPACLACGCYRAGLVVKIGWAEARCPLDPPVWGPVEAEAEAPE